MFSPATSFPAAILTLLLRISNRNNIVSLVMLNGLSTIRCGNGKAIMIDAACGDIHPPLGLASACGNGVQRVAVGTCQNLPGHIQWL
jgi:hypothetical protein